MVKTLNLKSLPECPFTIRFSQINPGVSLDWQTLSEKKLYVVSEKRIDPLRKKIMLKLTDSQNEIIYEPEFSMYYRIFHPN